MAPRAFGDDDGVERADLVDGPHDRAVISSGVVVGVAGGAGAALAAQMAWIARAAMARVVNRCQQMDCRPMLVEADLALPAR